MTKQETLSEMKTVLTDGLFIKEDTQFELDTTFEALGLDSLDKVEVKLSIEDAMAVTLEEDSFGADVQTVGDAVDLVVQARSSA
jgi:acyl carrier protein